MTGRRAAPLGQRSLRGLWRATFLPQWSGRNFTLVFAARAAMSAGRALAGVVGPIYLALEGFSAVQLAEYVMVVAFVSAVFSAAIGVFSDQVGRRVFLVVVPMLTAVAGVGFAFFNAPALLFSFGALGSFG
ncbi:MAG: hypothetical protein ACRDZX_17685, partial [Acidimicrobiales bacterium]